MRHRLLLSTLLLPSALAAQQLGESPPPQFPPKPEPTTIPGTYQPSPQTGPVEGQSAPSTRKMLLLDVPEMPPVTGQKTLYLDEHGPAGAAPGTERWIVTFWQRSFDLTEYRRAIYSEAAAEDVARIVANLEGSVRRDQAEFVAAVAGLGGKVTRQWWIINGCALEIPRTALAALSLMPNVAVLEPDRVYAPDIAPGSNFAEPSIVATAFIRTSTNAQNHNADAVQAGGLTGSGIGVAIMDTGQDRNMNATGQPHRTYFRDGIKPGTSLLALNRQMGAQSDDDTHGHGTGVCGIACGATWTNAAADHGHAYNANKLNYSICDVAGTCSTFDATRVSAWQQIATDRAAFNIRTANNSYGGSPSCTNSVQQALDQTARVSNVFVACAAGNGGASTAASQAVCNGLAVAACNPTAKTIAGFSSRGPLSGDTNRLYPDITGCGVGTVMPNADSETTNYVADGTSMASPQVCGAATLAIAANTGLTALETKSILLASTEDIAAQNPGLGRNDFGVGFLRDDLAVALARNNPNVFTDTIGNAASKFYSVYCVAGNSYAVAISWHRVNLATTAYNDVDLYVRNGGSGGSVIGTSNGTRNLYEFVRFTAPNTGTFTFEVRGFSVTSPATETFALAHTATTPLVHVRPDCHVVPNSEETRMSNSNNNIPFSWTPTRYQQLFLGSELGTAPLKLTGVALRQDEQFGSLAGQTVDLEIRLSHSTATLASMSATFASNLNSGSPTTVLPRTNVSLPAMPAANNNPAEFFFGIPFATPMLYNPARNLVIDVTQRGNSNGNATFTYPLDTVSGGNTTRVYGFPDTATTGTVGANYGLVMCFEGPEQCVFVPAAARDVFGNSNNNIPFSWTPTRYQQVFDASEMGGSAVFQAVGLRQDQAFGSLTGASVNVEVILGHTTFTPGTLTTTFDSNFTGSRTVVIPRQNVVLPNMGAAPTDPKDVLVHLPFARPFSYNSSNNLLIEVVQRGNSRGNATFTYPLDAHSSGNTTRLYGFPDTATTGTLGGGYGLVMCFDIGTEAAPGTYDYFGAGCSGSGPGTVNTVLPSSFAAVLGNGNNKFPFGAAPMRYQQVFLGSEAPSARTFNALELRQASGQVGFPGFGVDLQIELGYTTLNNASLTATYATNYNSGAPVTVVPRQLVVLPNFPTTAASPTNWFCRIPFNTPFNYVPAAGRNLLIQITNRGNNNGSVDFDYYLDAASGANTTRLFAIGDPNAVTGTLGVNYGVIMNFASAGATGAVPQLLAVGDPVIANTMSVNLWQGRASSVGILFLGFSNTFWGAIPLPLPLAGVGAPGCTLLASGDFLLTAPTNGAGFGTFPLSVPADPTLIGGQFWNQWAVFDPAANALSLSWSNGGHGTIGNL